MNTRYLIFKGRIFKNCGPSGAQKAALTADQNFQSAVTQHYQEEYATNTAAMNDLMQRFSTVIDQSPSQQGFSQEELAARNADTLNRAAATNQQVQQAIGERAAVSGAVPGVESGIVQAERAQASADVLGAANKEFAETTRENWQTGRENYYKNVQAALATPSAFESPTTAAANPVLGASEQVSGQANANEAASSSWMGLVGGLANTAMSFIPGPAGSMAAAGKKS